MKTKSQGRASAFQSKPKILLIDDDITFCHLFATTAAIKGAEVDFIIDPIYLTELKSNSDNINYDVVVVDYMLTDQINGLDISPFLDALFSNANLILISSQNRKQKNNNNFQFLNKSMGISQIVDFALEIDLGVNN